MSDAINKVLWGTVTGNLCLFLKQKRGRKTINVEDSLKCRIVLCIDNVLLYNAAQIGNITYVIS